jgi:hypothetical protein
VPARSSSSARALKLAKAALAVGAVLRIIEYATNRPLSIDESFLALNLVERSASALVHTLYFKQAAPLGFLEVEKLCVTIAGMSQYALRLFPLLVSLAALMFFYRAGKRLIPIDALPFACAAFALLDPLIYYSTAIKQYGFDVAVAVVLYSIAAEPMTRRRYVVLGVVGTAAVWFSHAAVFVLAAVGITLAIPAVAQRRWREVGAIGVMAVVWATSFALELLLSRSNLTRVQQAFAQGGHVLLGGTGTEGRSWFATATVKLRYLVGMEDTATGFPIFGSLPAGMNQGLTVLLVLLAAIGFVSLARRRPASALLFGIPPLLVVAASASHKYPLVGRTLVFLLPAIAFCLGEGMRVLLRMRGAWRVPAIALCAAAIAAIAILPAIHVVQARASEGIRPALRDLGRDSRPGDTLYVGQLAQYGFVYYAICGCSPFDPRTRWPLVVSGGPAGDAAAMVPRTRRLVLGAVNLPQGHYQQDVRRLVGRGRVWVLVSELADPAREPFIEALRRNGREVRAYGPYGVRGTAASLYLFELKRRG